MLPMRGFFPHLPQFIHSLDPLSEETRKPLEYEWFAAVFIPFHRIYYYYCCDILIFLS
jgi:hypothetical protein